MVEMDVELNVLFELLNCSDGALQIIVNDAGEAIVVAEQYRVAYFVDGWAPSYGGVGVAYLQ